MDIEKKWIIKGRFCMALLLCTVLSAYSDVIIDNGGTGTLSTGTWSVSGGTGPYDTNSLWARDDATYTWGFDSEPAGTYEVLMWWSGWPSRATDIDVGIDHTGGSEAISINQQNDAGQWNSIGEYYFDGSGSVTITAASGSSVSTCADAVWFRFVSSNASPTAYISSIAPNPAATGEMVAFSGNGEDLDGDIVAYKWQSSIDGTLSDAQDFSTDSLSEGVHVISFEVQDDMSQWSQAVSQVLIIGETPPETIIDNLDESTSQTGTWQVSGALDPYNAGSVWSRDGATFTWNFAPPQSGDYEVSMWWTQWDSRSTSVPIDIENAYGTERTYVDQQNNGGQWNSLGIYTFSTDVDGSVTLTAEDASPTSYCADAVKFTLVQANELPTAAIDSIGPSPARLGETVSFAGQGADSDGNVSGYNWQSSIDGNLSDAGSFSTSELSEGEHVISLTVYDDKGTGSPEATELLIVYETVEVIIDNGDPATSSTGSWNQSGGAEPYNEDSLYSRDGTTYTWTFTPVVSGNYDLSMWWTEWSSRATYAEVSIATADGTETVFINQQQDGGQWNTVGEYYFAAGAGYDVTITSSPASASTCADAVRFTLAQTNEAPTAIIDSVSPNPVMLGDAVSFAGHGTDSDGNVAGYSWQSSIDGDLSDANSFSTSELSSGEHIISFTVYDNRGAASLAATVLLTVFETVEIIIDNGDPATSSVGVWEQSGGAKPYNADSLYSRDGTTYTWTFNPPVTGYYELSMWWTEWPSRTTDAEVSIGSDDGTETVFINQQQNGGQWNRVHEYYYTAGTTYDVTITSTPGSTTSTCADAVRFVKVEEPGPPATDFYAESIRGPVPFTVNFNNQTTGDVDEWRWDFGDGQTSTEMSPSNTYTAPGVHTVSLTATGRYGEVTKTRYSYVDIKSDNTENIYICDGYGGNDYLVPDLTKKLQEMNAVETADGWTYQPANSDMTYYIYIVHDDAAAVDAFYEEDSHIIIAGHANYGFGLVFATSKETLDQRIDDYYFADDDRLVNYSTDSVSTKVDGMKYGQAYPNWEPVFKDGSSALMPYDFGDPRGNPPYNYFLTYQVPGDPNNYRIEIDGNYLERFPDSGVPAWYSPDGLEPDPVDNPEFFITNSDEYFNRFDSVGDWVVKKDEEGGYSGEGGYMGYNYQVQWPGSGSNVATWTMVLREPGEYRVLATWPMYPENAGNAKYTINHADGSSVFFADQTTALRRNSLGVYNFDAGVSTIELNDDANGQVVADAMILRPVADTEKILRAEFSANVTSGSAPLTVNFRDRSYEYIYDYSVDVNDLYWDFGDGAVSNEEDPSHTYNEPGIYTVTLRIVDTTAFEDTETKTDFIAVDAQPKPQAQFRASRMRGTQNTYVRFYDQSSGDIDQWHWDFGDGNDSNDINPVHYYTVPGTYTVSLTVSGPDGSDTEIEQDYIHNFIGESYTDNTFKTKPHFYQSGYSTFGKIICYAGESAIQKEQLGYTRLFHGSCNSFPYFGNILNRGVMYGKASDVRIEHDTATNYLEYYLLGYTDYDILDHLNSLENIHDFYNFTEKPLSLR